MGTCLVAQGLRIRLPMQGTRVQTLVREDPTCRGATKPVRHNYWACALEPVSHNYWAHVPQLLKPACLEPVLCSKRSHGNVKPVHRNKKSSPRSPQVEKARAQQRRPNAAKNKYIKKKKKIHWFHNFLVSMYPSESGEPQEISGMLINTFKTLQF